MLLQYYKMVNSIIHFHIKGRIERSESADGSFDLCIVDTWLLNKLKKSWDETGLHCFSSVSVLDCLQTMRVFWIGGFWYRQNVDSFWMADFFNYMIGHTNYCFVSMLGRYVLVLSTKPKLSKSIISKSDMNRPIRLDAATGLFQSFLR